MALLGDIGNDSRKGLGREVTTFARPQTMPLPVWDGRSLGMRFARPAKKNIVPTLSIATRVNGAIEAKRIRVITNGAVLSLPVSDQPTLIPHPGGSEYSVEILILGDNGDRRSEVWGPYALNATPLMQLSGNPPAGTVSTPYDYTFTLVGYDSPAIWSSTGTVPPGLVFEDGRLYGTPTTPGTYKFNVSVRDSRSCVEYSDHVIVVT